MEKAGGTAGVQPGCAGRCGDNFHARDNQSAADSSQNQLAGDHGIHTRYRLNDFCPVLLRIALQHSWDDLLRYCLGANTTRPGTRTRPGFSDRWPGTIDDEPAVCAPDHGIPFEAPITRLDAPHAPTVT